MDPKKEQTASAAVTSAESGKPRTCFVISPIGLPDSETRKKANQALKYLIKQALEPAFLVKRADDESRPGLITVQILQRIFDSDLVVADLTDRNPNVFYELAIRHAFGKPTIHIITKDDPIPFDVQDMRVVPYDLTNPDSLEEARNKIREYAKAIDQGEPVITPVQFAQIVHSFGAGESRDEQMRTLFASLSAGISNLQEGIAEIVQEQRNRKQREAFRAFGNPMFNDAAVSLASLMSPSTSGFNFATGQPSVYESSDTPPQRREAKAKAIADSKKSKGET